MKAFGAVTATAAAILLSAAGTAAFAQSGSSSPEQAQRTGSPPMEVSPVNGGASPDDRRTHPVLKITSVEVIRSAHAPVMDIIRVRGLASSSGWEEAELVPLTRGVPADGMLQLIFVARPPAEASDATGFEAVEAIFPLETNHPFKGVNVHSATESVTVSSLPGYTEGKRGGDDCGKCVGKYYVAKGASAPAGKSAGELIREEQIPATTRIIRPSDGIATSDSDPNRLTLIVNKDGRVTTAVWE